ncbi:hypothetical protein CK203_109315 [Vitis vinifera]|uniref:Uncharacterized protein n=1 Tax=Vitis vinifera TaxID=29760 RepID=A0A438C4T3_VITVI|nr:hypothetical protein CK203_109315 [Vitis vinifera]
MDDLRATYRDEDEEDDDCATTAMATANGVKHEPPEDHDHSDESKPSSDDDEEDPPPKKQKQLSSLNAPTLPEENQATEQSISIAAAAVGATETPKIAKKAKKKSNNVWTKSTSRKGKKKAKATANNAPTEDPV